MCNIIFISIRLGATKIIMRFVMSECQSFIIIISWLTEPWHFCVSAQFHHFFYRLLMWLLQFSFSPSLNEDSLQIRSLTFIVSNVIRWNVPFLRSSKHKHAFYWKREDNLKLPLSLAGSRELSRIQDNNEKHVSIRIDVKLWIRMFGIAIKKHHRKCLKRPTKQNCSCDIMKWALEVSEEKPKNYSDTRCRLIYKSEFTIHHEIPFAQVLTVYRIRCSHSF